MFGGIRLRHVNASVMMSDAATNGDRTLDLTNCVYCASCKPLTVRGGSTSGEPLGPLKTESLPNFEE